MGGYPADEQFEVQLGIVPVNTGLTIAGSQCFSDTVMVTSGNNGQLVLQAKLVVYTNITGGLYFDFMPTLAVVSTGGDNLQIDNIVITLDAVMTAFAAVNS